MHPLADPERSVLVSWHGERVVGLSRDDGSVQWRVDLETGRRGSMIVAGGRVFILQGNALTCLGYTTGKYYGRVELPFRPATLQARMVWDAGRLYIEESGTITCVSTDGKVLWTQEEFASAGRVSWLGFPGNVAIPDFTH